MASITNKIDQMLTYETMMKGDSNYKVIISGPLAGGAVSGVLNAPMPIAGANEFDSAKTALSKLPLFGKLFDGMNAISDVIKISGNDTTMSVEQTRKVWQESRTPQLSVELTFWNINSQGKPEDRPINKVTRIYSALFPEKRDDLLVSAPLGYKFTNDKGDAVGTLTLRIGQWFLATGLVMVDANFTPSLEVASDGTPLYFTGTVTLEPYKMITYSDYRGWFRTGVIRPVYGSGQAPKKAGSELEQFVSGVKKQADDFLGQFKKLG